MPDEKSEMEYNYERGCRPRLQAAHPLTPELGPREGGREAHGAARGGLPHDELHAIAGFLWRRPAGEETVLPLSVPSRTPGNWNLQGAHTSFPPKWHPTPMAQTRPVFLLSSLPGGFSLSPNQALQVLVASPMFASSCKTRDKITCDKTWIKITM